MTSTVIDQAKSVKTDMAKNTNDQIRAWREKRFLSMGWPVDDALLLAKTKICLHEAEHLLAQGCTHVLAAKILMGTTPLGDDPADDFSDLVKVRKK